MKERLTSYTLMIHAKPPGEVRIEHVANIRGESNVFDEIEALLGMGFANLTIEVRPDGATGRPLRFTCRDNMVGHIEPRYWRADLEEIKNNGPAAELKASADRARPASERRRRRK